MIQTGPRQWITFTRKTQVEKTWEKLILITMTWPETNTSTFPYITILFNLEMDGRRITVGMISSEAYYVVFTRDLGGKSNMAFMNHLPNREQLRTGSPSFLNTHYICMGMVGHLLLFFSHFILNLLTNPIHRTWRGCKGMCNPNSIWQTHHLTSFILLIFTTVK